MKELKLSNTVLVALVDDEDFERLSKFVWTYTGKSVQRKTYKRYKTLVVSLACEVMQNNTVMYDHKNRLGLDNQKENLRIATQQQNCFNTTKRLGTSSKYKGVSWDKINLSWKGRIYKNGKLFNLGNFNFENEAALAYNKMAVKLFGEFAVLNVIC